MLPKNAFSEGFFFLLAPVRAVLRCLLWATSGLHAAPLATLPRCCPAARRLAWCCAVLPDAKQAAETLHTPVPPACTRPWRRSLLASLGSGQGRCLTARCRTTCSWPGPPRRQWTTVGHWQQLCLSESKSA